jgi:hypothetical protein
MDKGSRFRPSRSPTTEPDEPAPSRPGPPRRPPRRQRSARAVAGVAILVAIGLLWPFADWNWWPPVTGLAVLVLVHLLRLDRLLFGWAPHLAGLVTVALLLTRTGPWAWGFAAGLALLGYGLVRLPDWRVLAAGVALTAVFGTGYGISQYRTEKQVAADNARSTEEQKGRVIGGPAQLALSRVANGIASGDPGVACGVLGPTAGAQFAVATGAPDCAAAVRTLAGQVTNPGGYVSAYTAPGLPSGGVVTQPGGVAAVADGCRSRVTPVPGPRLGRLDLRREKADQYVVVGYTPCR